MESTLFLATVFLTTIFSGSANPSVEYMSGNCGSSFTVRSSTRIKLFLWPSSSNNPCTVTFTGSNSYHLSSNTHLVARFRSINIPNNLLGQCTKARVDIIDSDGVSILSSPTGTCGSITPSTYSSTGTSLQVRLKKLQTAWSASGSFDILITRYSTGGCSLNEFECDSDFRCVSSSVTCDGYQDCPNDSDEIDNCYYSWSIGTKSGVVVAGIIFFIFVLLVITAAYRRRRYGRILWTSSVPYHNHCQTTTTTVVAPPPQSYPKPYP